MPKPIREVSVFLFAATFVLVPLIGAVGDANAQPDPPDTVGPPTEWLLLQIDPNPFCIETWGIAWVCFEAPEAADVEHVVLSPDSSTVLFVFFDRVLPWPGVFCYLWNGTDMNGIEVPEGLYPIRLIARSADGEILFQDTKIATISCSPNATDATTWGSLKSRFVVE